MFSSLRFLNSYLDRRTRDSKDSLDWGQWCKNSTWSKFGHC